MNQRVFAIACVIAGKWHNGKNVKRISLLALIFLACSGLLLAQRYAMRFGGGEGGIPEDAPIRTAREVPTHSTEFPRWTNSPGFEKDVFTFATSISLIACSSSRL